MQRETLLQNVQLLALLELDAAQLTHYLEDEILDNPFIELDYASEKKTPTLQADYGDVQSADGFQTLTTFVFEQIMMYRQTPIRDAMVKLVDYIDERGYIPFTYPFLAKELDLPEILVLDALTLIKQLEPAGVGAYDLRECLMLQTEQDSHAPNVAYYLLEEFFEQLTQQEYEQIALQSHVTLAEIQESVAYYQSLRAIPATLFDRSEKQELVPDMTLELVDGLWDLRYNREYYPQIVFNQMYYDDMLATQEPEVVSYVLPHQAHYKQLFENLTLREQLTQQVAQTIFEVQKNYFAHEQSQKAPLLIKDIARLTQLPETVVNLIVTNKHLAFEQQVYPFVDFITVATHEGRGGWTAADVKTMIQQLVAQDTAITNAQIVTHLLEKGITVSERTVALYR
ncbi:MAG: RNA polymerase subunit sigma-54 [Aerococcaceae bacterium]|nr:RNA polymerase subunit sigma-54 [Aerococcaceae bacterium]